MSRQVFLYETPERFVAGTVGEPGQRAFYLQARDGSRTTSVALEKSQVAVLAERVDELLDEVLRLSGGSGSVPAVAPTGLEDLAPLEAPVAEEFRVAALVLVWDAETERVVIEAQGPGAEPEEIDYDALASDTAGIADDTADDGSDDEFGDDTADVLRVRLTAAAARAFSKRALAVVSAGRPPCPFCMQPLDPEGHICPRANGYRRRD
jgi:uncharacterized repeat protein (TIGR03847 family)